MNRTWIARLFGTCLHHWIVRGDGDGILWLECLYCARRSVGWVVHPSRHAMACHGATSPDSKDVRTKY